MTDLGFPLDEALRVVREALVEDLGGLDGVDVTTEATIDAADTTTGRVVARAAGVVAGLDVIRLVYDEVCAILGSAAAVTVVRRAEDGEVPDLSGDPSCPYFIARGAKLHTRTKLMKKVEVKKVPTYKYVVEDLCAECQAKAEKENKEVKEKAKGEAK